MSANSEGMVGVFDGELARTDAAGLMSQSLQIDDV